MLWKSGRGIEPDVSIPCCSFLPPHFKKKPSKAVTLPLVKKRGTSCSQHDSVTGMEEMREKEFQQKQLSLPGSWQISCWHRTHFICITSVGLCLILTRRKDVTQGKDEFMETPLLPEENEQSCVERMDKDKRMDPRGCFSVSRRKRLIFSYLVSPFRWNWTALLKRRYSSVKILILK